MRVGIEAVTVFGPGLSGWTTARVVLRGEQPFVWQAAQLPPPAGLPPAERRRVGLSVKLALALAEDLFARSRVPANETATVFTSSGGDGDNCNNLCEALASTDPTVSPTRFTNSVHNAPAGYWSIAARSMAPSTSLCAHDDSFAAGLCEAATQVLAEGLPVALIAYDVPYPEPLHAARPISAPFGVAMMLVPARSDDLAVLGLIDIGRPVSGQLPALADRGLEQLRIGIPAARALPLLIAIARDGGRDAVASIEMSHRRVLPVVLHFEVAVG